MPSPEEGSDYILMRMIDLRNKMVRKYLLRKYVRGQADVMNPALAEAHGPTIGELVDNSVGKGCLVRGGDRVIAYEGPIILQDRRIIFRIEDRIKDMEELSECQPSG